MAIKDISEIPIGLRRICRRFESWLNRHKAPLPIPASVWSAATDAAKEFGVFQTAKILRLDYSKLKHARERVLFGVKESIRSAFSCVTHAGTRVHVAELEPHQ